MATRTLIIGASGQVGETLSEACSKAGMQVHGVSLEGTGQQWVDLGKPDSVSAAFENSRPELVFLCSAMTNVDACERDPEKAKQVNQNGSASVARECRRYGSKLVYLSTEYVFDGKSGPYAEGDPVNPLSAYGRTKLGGELAALELDGALSIRTTVVYSYKPGTKNFLMQLVDNHAANRKMRVPKDQYSNPTYAPELASAILGLVGKNASGIYNVVGPDWLNRYEFALKICKAMNFDPAFLEPKTTAELGQTAPRPLKAGLKTEKVVSILGRGLPHVEDSLAEIRALINAGRR